MRNFRLFAAGQVISNTGTWMQRVAQDWLVLELTHGSGTAVGIATGLQFLPMLLFGLWGGVIADRYSKRLVLMMTQASMGALALILGVLAVTGVVQVWQVYLLAFGLGMAAVVDNPTRQSFAVEMVGREDLPNAIGLNSAVFNLARITGPALAGLVIGLVGTPAAFFLNAASYLTVLVSLKLMRTEELRPSNPVPRAKGQLREGLAYVRSSPDLLMTLLLVFFVATFGMNFQVTTALMSRVVFGTGAGRFGIASAVFAAGALAGALIAARRRQPGMRLLIGTALGFGVLEIATGLMPSYWSFLILLIPTGLAVISFSTTANSTIQLGSAAKMRGRVMGIYMLVFLGGAPLGSPLTGWVAQVAGTRISMIAGGVLSLAATMVIAALLARSRRAAVSQTSEERQRRAEEAESKGRAAAWTDDRGSAATERGGKAAGPSAPEAQSKHRGKAADRSAPEAHNKHRAALRGGLAAAWRHRRAGGGGGAAAVRLAWRSLVRPRGLARHAGLPR